MLNHKHCSLLFLFCLGCVPYTVNPEEKYGCSQGLNIRAVRLDDRWALMRNDGKILTAEFYWNCEGFSENLILCSDIGDGNVYLSPEGRTRLRVDGFAEGFSEGLAAVSNKKGLWGYLNKGGEWVINPQFDKAGEFKEGLAAVALDGIHQYINKMGERVLAPRADNYKVDFMQPFHSGAAIIIGTRDGNYLTKGMIDRSGKWIVAPGKFGFTGDFSRGLVAAWTEDGKVGFMNSKGECIIAPAFSDYSRGDFEEGLIAVYVKKHGRKQAGFIDLKGKWVILPKYEAAGQFCCSLAPVSINGKWGYIDKTGKFIIPPMYEYAQSFQAGIAIVGFRDKLRKLREAYINAKGSIIYLKKIVWFIDM
jgi:hypothetical protein